VVIPTYNRQDVVGDAVASVLSQTLDDFEILVVDDGSTDGTVQRLKARFPHEPRLRILTQENGGCCRARNRGLAEARAPWVALLDSDDRCLPERLARQVAALEAEPGAALCVCDAWHDRGPVQSLKMSERHTFAWPTSLDVMFQGAWAAPSVWMLRTDVARRLGFDEAVRYQEDIDFLFRLHEAGERVVVVPEVLVVYHDHPDSGPDAQRMSNRKALMNDYGLLVFKRHWELLDAAGRARVGVPTRIRRLVTRHCEATGRHARARHHLLAWWKERKLRGPLLWRWLTNLRPDRPSLAAAPLGDLDLDG
jgi:glycosyltransferase involved in cell wall biosynthesis